MLLRHIFIGSPLDDVFMTMHIAKCAMDFFFFYLPLSYLFIFPSRDLRFTLSCKWKRNSAARTLKPSTGVILAGLDSEGPRHCCQ